MHRGRQVVISPVRRARLSRHDAPVTSLTTVATLEITQDVLRLRMSRTERLAGLHTDITVPVSDVISITAVDDPWTTMRGMRAPGPGIPKVLMIGTTRTSGTKDFCVVRGRGPAVVVTLSTGEFARLIVSDPTAESTAAQLTASIDG